MARRSFIRIAVLTVTLLAGVVVVPYSHSRMTSHRHALSVETVSTNGDSALAPETLRIGCYNIAHGRGDTPGGSNWSGGTPEARTARLIAIADLLTALDLDIVVLNEVDFDR